MSDENTTLMQMVVEITLPDDISNETVEAILDDLTYEDNMLRLERLIARWVRLITDEKCHVAIDFE